MRNKKFYEWLLLLTYVAMVLLCLGLNLLSGQKEDLANIIVNAVMFVIVAAIFLTCELKCFSPMSRIVDDLEKAASKIRKDAMNSHEYLWEPYSQAGVELFTDETLKEAFGDYRFELNRNEENRNGYYKCSIEDYINPGIVDTVMHRNQLNQVAGALTGLGILGTFIGLSLGLQQFNTGSTAEITGSIEPLMNGIKVAFHTSIYGMVFSLVFNYVYKRKLYDSEQAVDKFISAWKKFVMPDTEKDGTNRMLQLQENTLEALNGLTNRMSEEISAQLAPNFERLEKIITEFTKAASSDQKDALRLVVNSFVEEMNRSLGGSFAKLSSSMEEQAKLCRGTVQMVDEYYARVMKTEDEMQKNILSLNMQNESNHQMLLKAKDEFKVVVDACDDATDAADELRLTLEKNAKSRR